MQPAMLEVHHNYGNKLYVLPGADPEYRGGSLKQGSASPEAISRMLLFLKYQNQGNWYVMQDF